jgi:predicted AlkP superfamily phosphohydrolase/phosphomutase
VVVVGLDACDPATARRLASAGHLPTLGRLFAKAARCRVRNPVGLFVGALWMTFANGLRPDRHGFHCWDEIDVATYVRRLTVPQSRHAGTTFWRALSEAGRRVAVLDVPHARADVPIDGIQVAEWGCHDRHFGFHTWPPAAAGDIESTFGLHPVLGLDPRSVREFSPDDYAHRAGPLRTREEEHLLFEGLLRGLAGKRRLSATLLAEGEWDLFLTVFGESHAIGHQQWHLHDRSHPRFDPATRDALGGDPLLRVYQELDAALGELLSLVDDRATVLVLLSHGMGPHYDGTYLLDEILRRIDRADRGADPGRRPTDVLKRAARSLSPSLQRGAAALAMPALRRRASALSPCPEYVEPNDRARQRFFVEPNNAVYGGVRFNLAGREPSGCVRPEEVDRLCARLSRDLLALVNVATGGRAVRGVERADRWYRRSAVDTMPDLFVDWERAAPIETVWSPKTGSVHAPYSHWRTGDHRPDGLLLAHGPGVPTSTMLGDVNLEDLPASIAARFGIGLEDVDGHPVPWLIQ